MLTFLEEPLRRQSDQLLLSINRAGRRADYLFGKLKEAEERLREFEERYPEWLGPDPVRGASYIFPAAAIVTTFGLDVFCTGAGAQYIVATSGLPPYAVEAATYSVPALLALADLTIGYKIELAKEEEANTGHSRTKRWRAIGFLFILGILSLTAATQFAVLYLSELPPIISTLLLVSICGISVIAHTVLLFLGRAIREARRYFAAKKHHRKLKRQIRLLEDQLAGAENTTLDQLKRYKNLIAKYQEEYGKKVEAGPFEQGVHNVISRRYPKAA